MAIIVQWPQPNLSPIADIPNSKDAKQMVPNQNTARYDSPPIQAASIGKAGG